MITVNTRCEYCGEPGEINIELYIKRATAINSLYDLKCPKCGKIGKPEFTCRLRWIYEGGPR